MPLIQYNAPRTLSKFLNSSAFIRCVVGPVGCTDGETEFLTPTGWRRIDAYVPGDQVAQWEHGTDELTFVYPDEYISAPAESFILFENEHGVSMALSPNHRMPLYDWAGQFVVKTAEKVAARPSRHRVPTAFRRTAGLGLSADEIRLRVMVAADGHYPAIGNQCLVTVRKERKKARVRALLTAAQIDFKEATYPNRPTETRFSFRRPEWPKPLDLSAEWYRASSEELAVLLDEVEHWDGLHDHEESRFSTSKRGEADVVQYAAHACGRVAHVRTTPYQQECWQDTHTVQWSRAGSARCHVGLRGDNLRITSVAAVGGSQYCFSVPSTFWLARRNGRIFITGNSGKSSACAMEILIRASQQAPSPDKVRRTRFAVIRNTYRELKDTTRKTFEQWIPGQLGKWHEQDFTFTLDKPLADGTRMHCEVLFRALDRPEHVKKLLSLELTGAYINEARQVPKAILDVLTTRVGRYPSAIQGGCSWSGIWMDTNPWAVQHWGYRLFSKEKPPEHELFEQPDALGPNAENLENLTKDKETGRLIYYERLCYGKDQAWIDEYVRSKYPSHDKGSIYGAHIAALESRGALAAFEHPVDLVFTAWDLGRADSTAIWFFTIRAGGVDVLDHYENHGQGPSHYFGILTEKQETLGYRYVKHWLPHDARAKTLTTERSMIEQMVDRFGVAAVGIAPELGVADGIAAVRTMLEGDIRFHARCDRSPVPGINSGLESLRSYKYAWNEALQTFSKEPQHSGASHSADSARYMALAIGKSRELMPAPKGFPAPPGTPRGEPNSTPPPSEPLLEPATLEEHKEFILSKPKGRGRIG